MFSNFSWTEMLVIACVAIIVVGPKELPGMLRAFGKTIGKIKRMAGDFQRQVDDAIREADLDDVKDMAKNKTFAPLEDAKKSMEEFANTMKDPLEAHKSVVNDELEAPAMIDEIEAPAVEADAEKTPVTKAPVKKTVAKKAPARKPAEKKPTVSKTAAKKPAVAKKPAPKRTAAKKPAPAKSAT